MGRDFAFAGGAADGLFAADGSACLGAGEIWVRGRCGAGAGTQKFGEARDFELHAAVGEEHGDGAEGVVDGA